MVKYYSINGTLVAANKAVLGLNDLGIIRGFSIFDYFKIQSGQPLYIDDYLNRFLRSADLLNLDLPYSFESLKDGVFELIEANNLANGDIRLLATGGYSPDSYTPVTPNVAIMQYETKPKPLHLYQKGVKLLSIQYRRDIPEVKTTNYAVGIQMLPKLKEKGAFEVLYLDGHWVREAVRSNIFIVNKEGSLITPNKSILWGITRKYVLEVARTALNVEERELTYEELTSAKEVFITSSTKWIMPVVAIDDFVIGNGEPGPTTQKLMHTFAEHVNDYLSIKV